MLLLALQIIMEGVELMKERILEEKRRRESRPASKMSLLASQLMPASATVLKAKGAFKRDMLSEDLTVKGQLVGLANISLSLSLPLSLSHLTHTRTISHTAPHSGVFQCPSDALLTCPASAPA